MSGHVTRGAVDGTETVLERIQKTVLPGSTKPSPMANVTLSSSTEADQTEKQRENAERNTKISNTQRVWTSLLAGAAAGALAKTTIAPLDRTKINFQISKQPYSVKGAARFIIKSFYAEGLLSLWRGNSATMARIMPYAAIQFTAHEQWQRILGVHSLETSHPARRMLAGSLAGVTSQALTYPLDLVRARMAVTQKSEYRTLRQAFVRIYRQEGMLAYYRGFTATILGVIPYAGFSFFTYESLKTVMAVYTVHSPGFMAVSSLICGALAGAVSQTSSYPLDIVRRRMQTSAITGEHYHTVRSTIASVYRQEGLMAFFKGLSMNWVKGPVAVGISFATYDTIRDMLRKIVC